MENSLVVIIGLFMAVVGIGIIAKKTAIPYPIALMFGGLLLSFLPFFFPRLPPIVLDPELVFLTILPPILFSGGYFLSVGGFRKNALMIGLLAVGLVLITTVVIAGVANAYSGMPWAAAFALGAIVSPPDATAATVVTQKLKISHNIATIIDAESLVNDATALVIFRLSLAALAAGSFSLPLATGQFFFICSGGIAIGLAVGFLAAKLIERIDESALCITISLICPYLTYLLANQMGLSGVLAAVTAGLYMGYRIPKAVDALIHLEAVTVWKTVVFLINGMVFILIGLQLPVIMADLVHYPLHELIIYPILINLAHIVVRFLWVFATMYLPTKFFASFRARYPYLDWKYALVVSWCGMRGVISLAAAMSLPLIISDRAVPDRSIIIYLTFTVIFFTLAVQGLTLPYLIRILRLHDEKKDLLDEAKLKKKIAQTALSRLSLLSAEEGESGRALAKKLSHQYEDTLGWANRIIHNSQDPEREALIHRSKQVQREILLAQRREVIELHEQGYISSQLLRKVLDTIDFESAHLEGGSS